MEKEHEYILGVNQTELKRLEFQHSVWGPVTNKLLDRINIQKNWKCLDGGAGPGFVSMDILKRLDGGGELTALEPSALYLDHFKEFCLKKHYEKVKFIHSVVEDARLEDEYYDFIFLRWVIDFVTEPEKFLLKLLAALKKGGVIAIEDYTYEGIALFPKGGPFDDIAEIVRSYWRAGGGDMYFTTKIPEIFRKNNVELREFTPISRAGDKDSGLIEWAHKFFTVHLQLMADKKIITQNQANELLKDWLDHRNKPETIFFSPIVVDIVGIKN